MSARAEILRLGRFCVVGASNTAITFVAYLALVGLGGGAALASAVGFAIGAANGYHWNARWTFATGALRPHAGRRYALVQALGAGCSAAGVAAARGAGLTRVSAEVVILPGVTVLMYVLSRRVVFSGDPAACAG